jgi:hypothetical protein
MSVFFYQIFDGICYDLNSVRRSALHLVKPVTEMETETTGNALLPGLSAAAITECKTDSEHTIKTKLAMTRY